MNFLSTAPQMKLRSGRRKPAREISVEDDEKESVAEDRAYGALENIREDVVDGENAILKRTYSSSRTHNQEKWVWRNITVEQPSFGVIQGHGKEISLLILLIFLSLVCQTVFSNCNEGNSNSDCINALDKLYQEYPQYKTFWKGINATYKICSKSDRPGVILLLHNGNGSIANCIVNRTASLLSRLIGVSQTGEYFSVDGRTAHQDFETNSFLNLVLEQRQRLGVVVFTYLEQMDCQLVGGLHFICDSDPNIAGRAIIILVLKVETQTFEGKNVDDLAKRQLRKLWKKGLDYGSLEPIIARITNVIASIDENVFTKCS